MNATEEQPIEPTAPQVAAAVNTLHATVTDAFTSFGDGMLGLLKNQQEAANMINQLVADRDHQLNLVGKLTEIVTEQKQRIDVLAALVDSDHYLVEVLAIKAGVVRPPDGPVN